MTYAASFPCRCQHCRARRTLSMPPQHYVRPLRCACGSRDWSIDAYRKRSEHRRSNCDCSGYTFLHRRGSRWCEHSTNPTMQADVLARFGQSDVAPWLRARA